jgi:RimJ/RimL family protein N-acetyltransferase
MRAARPPSQERTLAGTLVFLRPLAEEDATDAYAAWLNDPEVNRWLETHSVTLPELRAYIREKRESPHALLLGIFWKETGQHIGNVKLEPIDREKREATIGILIGEKAFWGKGVATEATNLATEHAFSALGMRAVTLGVIPENTAAIRVYEKCGFTRVRIDAKAVNHDGVLYDRWVYRREVP